MNNENKISTSIQYQISNVKLFYQKLGSNFISIFNSIVNDSNINFKKKLLDDFQGENYFIGGVNKNYITIRRKKDFNDCQTLIHEVGHAIAGYLLFNESNIEKITINAEGKGSLGYVMYKANKSK